MNVEVDLDTAIRLTLDANRLTDRLWQGSAPPAGDLLGKLGFDVVVLCADDVALTQADFPGVTVVQIATKDEKAAPVSAEHARLAHEAAAQAVQHHRDGKTVLVTCLGGFNRSGLVSALVLHELLGWPYARCVRHIQEARDFALHNKFFVRYLKGLDP